MRGFDDLAPSVPVVFEAGAEIKNLDADEAEQLISLGAVELI